jgi:stearoyl-CoA desaturase (delta-9 desaturase)
MVDDSIVVSSQATRAQRATTLLGVLIPFFGVIAAIVCSWGWGFKWSELGLLLGMYLATGLGITVGYHRLFVHRSFDTVGPVRFALAVLGSMSVEGPLLKWAAIHRQHHKHSDQADDPHSPHGFGGGVWGVLRGLWHAHMGWMFAPDPPNLGRLVRDLYKDKLLRVANRLFGVWVILGLLIPAALGAAISGTWTGALLGFIWGGLVRIFLVHHLTWSINSVCHLWGRRPFQCDDESRNNFVCGIFGLGEGWHNNHHAFPASARHGLRWWEFDFSFYVIRGLEMLGLVWRVRIPNSKAMIFKRRQIA